ncbi:hypothetical protein PUN28_017702 [Cardiocondyla obscurior]|uniref:Uncharacterized protein n=1 Tax=Cardiocondyla obscurior TaxID=286306 RepID=A0AAW2ELD1_9HYME
MPAHVVFFIRIRPEFYSCCHDFTQSSLFPFSLKSLMSQAYCIYRYKYFIISKYYLFYRMCNICSIISF